jgi:hypothetical protein
MRSLKVTLMAVSAATAFCCATMMAQTPQNPPNPQNPPPPQNPQKPEKQDKSGSAPTAAKDIVVVDASSQLAQLKDQKVGAGKKLASAPINLSQATGYRQGLNLVAFRLSGTIDKAENKPTGAEDETKGDKPTAAGTSDKGSGTVVLQAIVSPRPDLTYEEVMRIINRGADKGAGGDKGTGGDKAAGGTEPGAPGSDPVGAAVLCECRTSTMVSGSKGRTFEVVGFAPAEGRTSPEMIADVKRRLTETSAAAAKADPGSPGAAVGSVAAEPKPQDVKQALDLIEKGKAFLYINLMPEMGTAGKGEHDMGAAGGDSSGGCTLKDIALVFAAVPKSAP